MAWTYSGDPGNSNRDWVRWKTGLTDEDNQLVTDEEINAELSAQENRWMAASEVTAAVAAMFARDATYEYAGQIMEEAGSIQEHFQMLSENLAKKGKQRFGRADPVFSSVNSGDDHYFSPGIHDN